MHQSINHSINLSINIINLSINIINLSISVRPDDGIPRKAGESLEHMKPSRIKRRVAPPRGTRPAIAKRYDIDGGCDVVMVQTPYLPLKTIPNNRYVTELPIADDSRDDIW